MAFKSKQIKRRASQSNLEVQIEGILEKRSTGLRKIWQKRFFVLESQFLKYYDSESKKSMKGAMDLNHLVKIRVNPTGERDKAGEEKCEIALELEAPKNDDDSPGGGAKICYLLRSSSTEDANRWHEFMSPYLREPEEPKKEKKSMLRRFSFNKKKKEEGGDSKKAEGAEKAKEAEEEEEEEEEAAEGEKEDECADKSEAEGANTEKDEDSGADDGDDDGDGDAGEGEGEGEGEGGGDSQDDTPARYTGKSPELVQALELEEARCAATFASAIDPKEESIKGRLYVVFKLENFFKLPEGCGEPSLTMILGDVNPPLEANLNSSILKMPVDDYAR
jgi:hypothetical protein